MRGDVSGGTHTSHTIVVGALVALLDAVPSDASSATYERATLEANVLGKDTEAARRGTYRHLREVDLLRPESLLSGGCAICGPIDPPRGMLDALALAPDVPPTSSSWP